MGVGVIVFNCFINGCAFGCFASKSMWSIIAAVSGVSQFPCLCACSRVVASLAGMPMFASACLSTVVVVWTWRLRFLCLVRALVGLLDVVGGGGAIA